MKIPHHSCVDLSKVEAHFSLDHSHRHSLHLPFIGKTNRRPLCIIGQNPSKACREFADKTINYLERYIHEGYPQYSGLIILNLFSRIDTTKSALEDLITTESETLFSDFVRNNHDFMIIWGKLKKQGIYDFPKRVKEIKQLFVNKNVYKLDINSTYPPHPGNPKVLYSNFEIPLSTYDFSDIKNSRA